MRLAVAGCVLAAVLALSTTDARAAVAADAPAPPSYSPPVPGAVVDDWRPPQQKWGAGNRGVDFDAPLGGPVVAAADGEVVFAGSVAGAEHVVVLHADGLRTSYSFLAEVDVHRGDHVAAGQQVGVAAGPVHFGVRAGDEYLDPLTVLGGGPPAVHLVDDRVRRPGTVAEERDGLTRVLRGATRTVVVAGDWVRDRAVDGARTAIDQSAVLAGYAGEHSFLTLTTRIAGAVLATTGPCTPAAAAPPARSPGRRILVRVAGLDSHTGEGGDPTAAGAVARLDAGALGYAGGDDIQFSYAGGTTDERPYARQDTWQPIRESGARLAALLDRVAADNPGVPIDVVAHSMGGLVARTALATTQVPVAHLVTLATPHGGADLATAGRTVRSTAAGGALVDAADAAGVLPLDPGAPSIRDLAEGSTFLGWLDAQPRRDGTAITSVAGRHDYLVPVPRAHLDGATNVVVDPAGLRAEHDALPGSPEAARAVALALADAPPPCQSVAGAIYDQVSGEAISLVEDGLGAGGRAVLR
jgi:pimeloyl-ACP methyl ester carboxylesterase